MKRRPRFRPPSVRGTVVQLPNGFTLLNLMFGIGAIVMASRGLYDRAVWFVVFGGIADALDGRVARAVGATGRFGEELDSLVDAISFGLAPGLIVYFYALRHQGFDWVFVFLFSACAVIRLARFNVTQAGTSKTHFIGLPSPAAGGTLATYYWFSTTDLYRQTVIGEWPWQYVLRFLMLLLAFLMISDVPYPAWPRFTLRTWRGRIGIIVMLGMIIGLILIPNEFLFPLAIAYIAYGIVVAVVVGLTTESPDEDFFADEESLAPPPVDMSRMARRTPAFGLGPGVIEEPPTAGHRRPRRRNTQRNSRVQGTPPHDPPPSGPEESNE